MKRVLTSPQNLRKQKEKKQQKRNSNGKKVKNATVASVVQVRDEDKYILFSNQDLYGDHTDEALALEQQIAQYVKKPPQTDESVSSQKTTQKNKGNYECINNGTIKQQWSRDLNIKTEVELKNTEKLAHRINMKSVNQKLEGWITQNSSSHHFLVDQSGNVCQIQYELDFKKLKTLQSTPDQKMQSRPLSRNNSKNKQFETQNFLKEIRLKYAKALKFRENQQQHNKFNDKFLGEASPILIEDDQIDKQEQNLSDSNHFIKYSQRKTFLNLKKITPDANQNIGSSRNFKKNAYAWENLEERINHDCLIPRPSSKKRSRISPGDLSISLSNEKKLSKSINNLQQNIRQKTIDPSQLSSRKKKIAESSLDKDQKVQQMGYRRLKNSKQARKVKSDLLQSASSNLLGPLNQSNSKLLFKNNRPLAQSNKRSTLVKIKLKYLKSLKYGHYPHLSHIEPQNLQKAKIASKPNSYRTINTEICTANFANKNSPKCLTHRASELKTSRKKFEQFERLKKLLRKQEQEPAYLICQKQSNTANIEYQ